MPVRLGQTPTAYSATAAPHDAAWLAILGREETGEFEMHRNQSRHSSSTEDSQYDPPYEDVVDEIGDRAGDVLGMADAADGKLGRRLFKHGILARCPRSEIRRPSAQTALLGATQLGRMRSFVRTVDAANGDYS